MSNIEKNRTSKGSFIFVFLTVMIDMMGIGIIIPVVPKLIQSLTGETLSDAALTGGLLYTSYAIVQFLFAPVLGELSDRFGRKPVLLIALLGLGLDYFIHAFSPTIAWLFFGRILAGMFGASHSVAFAYVADISSKENKARNFGFMGAAFGLGFMLGPGIGGIIGDYWGIKAPFFVAGGLSILNFVFGLLFVHESLIPENRRKVNYKKMLPFVSLAHLGKYKAVLGLILAFGLAQLAGQVMPSTWSYFTMEAFEWDEWDVGLSLSVVGLLVSLVQAGLTGVLVKKFGNKRVIMAGFIFYAFGMMGIAFAGNSFLLYAFMVPYVLGGIAGPTIQGLVSNHVPANEQGNLQGVLSSLSSMSAFTIPVIYTFIFSVYTSQQSSTYFPGAPFLLAGLILLVACLVAFFSVRTLIGNKSA